jgi:adenylate cyclase
MDEVAIQAYEVDLVKAVGKDYKSALKTLLSEGFINSFTNVIEIRIDKDKAIHLQSLLLFSEAKDIPASPTLKKKDDT